MAFLQEDSVEVEEDAAVAGEDLVAGEVEGAVEVEEVIAWAD